MECPLNICIMNFSCSEHVYHPLKRKRNQDIFFCS